MLERHKLLMGRTQDRAGQNNGSIGVFWRSFNGIIGHIRYMFRGLKITHNHEHSSLYDIHTQDIRGGPSREQQCLSQSRLIATIGTRVGYAAAASGSMSKA